MAANPFFLDADAYQRRIDPIGDYKRDCGFYLSRMTDTSLDDAIKHIETVTARDGELAWTDPTLHYLYRDPDTGDRSEQQSGIAEYIYGHLKANSIISPTLTTYKHSDDERSLISDFADGNIAARDVIKAEMFDLKQKGDEVGAYFKKLAQSNKKINNNGLSGGHVSPSTILYNRSAHSTLTSTCRITASFGNINDEKFLSGRRHYHNDQIGKGLIKVLLYESKIRLLQHTAEH